MAARELGKNLLVGGTLFFWRWGCGCVNLIALYMIYVSLNINVFFIKRELVRKYYEHFHDIKNFCVFTHDFKIGGRISRGAPSPPVPLIADVGLKGAYIGH